MSARAARLARLSRHATLLALLAACGDGRNDAAVVATDQAASAPAGVPADGLASRRFEQREELAVGAVGAAGAPALAPEAGTVSGPAADGAPPPAPPPAPAAAPPAVLAAQAQTEAAPAMVIRTGQASVEVDSLEPALAALRALAARLGGHVANAALAGGRDQVRTATLQLRVPAERFDALVGGLSPLGRVETVNVQAQDVGEEYVDVAARVANARRLEARLVTLLERGTARLSDVLHVERELARVREEIERAEGRMRFLRARAALSTLEVTAHEPPPLVGPSPTANPLAEAVRDAWRNFLALLAFVIASLGVVVPVGATALVGWRVARRWRKAEVRAG
jgi:hypothetical protein